MGPGKGWLRRLAILFLIGIAAPASLLGQDADVEPPPPPRVARPTAGVWWIVGVSAELSKRWQGTLAGEYLRGLCTSFVSTNATFAAHPEATLTLGYIYIRTTGQAGVTPIHLYRVGGAWIPIRKRIEIDNRA